VQIQLQPTERLNNHLDKKFEKSTIQMALLNLERQSPFKQMSEEKFFPDSPDPNKLSDIDSVQSMGGIDFVDVKIV
jgi:hypothetical protein